MGEETSAVAADIQTAEAARAEPQSPERIRTLDFSQPTKFVPELRRRVARVLDPFCEALAGRMSTELRTAVELRLTESSQLTWAAAKAQLPADSIAVTVEAHRIDRQMLMNVELPFILQALECLLGGDASQAPAERRLSEIDWTLTRGLLHSMISQLSLAWRDLGGVELALGEMDIEGDAGVVVPIGEPTFAITLESSIDGRHSTISLLIPWRAIEPLADDIVGQGSTSHSTDPLEAQAVSRGVASAQVMLRAEVGSVQMPMSQMLALVPGALLSLEDRAEDGVHLFAEGVSIGRGRPGRSGPRRAVKLTSTSEHLPRVETHPQFARSGPEPMHGRVSGSREAPEGLSGLRNIPVRVWAELGRTHIPLRDALELTTGSVVEFTQGADEPVELFVNGVRFAHGSLVVTGDGEWGVQVAELV